jgi:hypothetical protein
MASFEVLLVVLDVRFASSVSNDTTVKHDCMTSCANATMLIIYTRELLMIHSCVPHVGAEE